MLKNWGGRMIQPAARILLACVFASAAAEAWAGRFEIDAVHSSVSFKVRHMVVSKTSGKFNDFAGTLDYDPKAPGSWKTEAVIKAASIDTGNADRDKHLRSKDFFDTDKYPEIRFVSTKVETAEDGRTLLHGKLTLHGVTKDVALALEAHGVVPDAKGNIHAGFSATTKINRMDYGISYSKILDTGGLAVGDTVEISIEIEAIEPKAK